MQNFPVGFENIQGLPRSDRAGDQALQPREDFADILRRRDPDDPACLKRERGRTVEKTGEGRTCQEDEPGKVRASDSKRKHFSRSQSSSQGEQHKAFGDVPTEERRQEDIPGLDGQAGNQGLGNGAGQERAHVLETFKDLGFSSREIQTIRALASRELQQCPQQEMSELLGLLQRIRDVLQGAGGQEAKISQLLQRAAEQLETLFKASIPQTPAAAKQGQQRAGEKAAQGKRASAEPLFRGFFREGDSTQAGQEKAAGLERVSEAAVRSSEQHIDDRARLESQQTRSGQQRGPSGHPLVSESRTDSGGTGQHQGGQENESDWKSLWRSILKQDLQTERMDPSVRRAFQDKADALIQQILGRNGQAGTLKGEHESGALRQNVLKQVENGLLRNLGQGRRELVLKLHPPELGSLRISLQVQGKDVAALIKTNSQEAGRLVQQQMSNLQQILEQQGLKVQKLDVQTFVQQEGSGQQWLGQNGHNQAQEQRDRMERRSWLNRWRQSALEEVEDPDLIAEEASLQKVSRRSILSTIA